jgi:cellulose/xylan binding protein with CBM9 domain
MFRKFPILLALAVLVVTLGAVGGWAYENCNGFGYFALQVPDPGSIVVDGKGNDWGWYDPDFIINTDEMCNTLGGDVPPLSDIDIAIHAGWTPEPDNRLYVFARVVDDSLNIDESAMNDGWKDDDMEIILDPNHAGGWNEAADAIRSGHQQWTFHVTSPGGYPSTAFLRWNQPPEMQWGVEQGLVEAATDVQPPGSGHGSVDVTVGYEVRMQAFDPYMPEGLDASTRHVFVAGQTIGMSVTFSEADEGGRSHQISTHVQEGGAHSSDFTSEFTLVAVGEYATAVEATTWGAVKALLK